MPGRSGRKGSRYSHRPSSESDPQLLPWNPRSELMKFVLPGEDPRELDRALDGVGAVVDEEGVLEVSRRDLAEELRERAAQRVQELLARERHALELVGDGLDDFGMPDAGAVDAVAAEAVDVGAAREVLERRALAGPLEGRVVAQLDHGLAVLEVAAVVVGVEVIDRVGLDPGLLLRRELRRGDDVEPALGFLDQLLRVHVPPRSSLRQTFGEPLGVERLRVPDAEEMPTRLICRGGAAPRPRPAAAAARRHFSVTHGRALSREHPGLPSARRP